jgi:hypothetical protein
MARYIKKNGILKPVSGAQFADAPLGTIYASFLAICPKGLIKGDGTVYTKADYPELYEGLPDVFKDTTNETFSIDLREATLKGIGLSSLTENHYSSTGLTLGEFIEDRIKSHNHVLQTQTSETWRTVNTNTTSSSSGVNDTPRLILGNGTAYEGTRISSNGSATNEVKSVGVNYFIKAKQIGLPADFAAAIEDVVDDKLAKVPVTISNSIYFQKTAGSAWIENDKLYIVATFRCVQAPTSSSNNVCVLDTDRTLIMNSQVLAGSAHTGALNTGNVIAVRCFTFNTWSVGTDLFINGVLHLQSEQ